MTNVAYDRSAKAVDLISNRVGIINELFGCRYHHMCGNPLVFRRSRATRRYELSVFGCVAMSSGTCDYEGLEQMFEVVHELSEIVSLLRRGGMRFPCIQ